MPKSILEAERLREVACEKPVSATLLEPITQMADIGPSLLSELEAVKERIMWQVAPAGRDLVEGATMAQSLDCSVKPLLAPDEAKA